MHYKSETHQKMKLAWTVFIVLKISFDLFFITSADFNNNHYKITHNFMYPRKYTKKSKFDILIYILVIYMRKNVFCMTLKYIFWTIFLIGFYAVRIVNFENFKCTLYRVKRPDIPSNSRISKIVYRFFMYISIANKSPVLHEGKPAFE